MLVLLVVYALLLKDYLGKRQEQEGLAGQIAEMSRMLEVLPPPPTDLGERLSAAKGELEAARKLLPERLSSTEVINAVLRLAEATDVRVIPIITQPWATEHIAGQDYTTFRMTATATSSFKGLETFISALESSPLPSLLISSLTMERLPEPAPEGETFRAVIEIVIYAQMPSSGAYDEVE